MTITQEYLKSQLSYDPNTGLFTRIADVRNGTSVGSIAGGVNRVHGYRYIRLAGKKYRSSRLVWLYLYGVWPTKYLDHINRVRDDDRISNLREATASQNTMNTRLRSDNTSGYRGVVYEKRYNKWQAYACLNKVRISLGMWDTAEQASIAYEKFAKDNHGEYYIGGNDNEG